MSPQHPVSFRLEDEIVHGLKFVQERDGIPQTEQVRRALRAWLAERGVLAPPPTKTARKRAATSKRA
jgi:hypothetical protein